eukprot:CAMPEP_0174922132 /NCGR_PEP_ID=MMETSP1355-20121228/5652_1 /TAXON_ID=464990 /ORGANISM="Hemiselmis tepida, Strain CCMP443" /LENGTH=208 /DNA_ID=CAMNT_0016167693 /DNA_START=35 /DNA_END=661 /DNA_ORIENTATION=-
MEALLDKACAVATAVVTGCMDFAAGPPLVPPPKAVKLEGLEDEEEWEPCTVDSNGAQFIHAAVAGLLGSTFIGALQHPAHIEALAPLRRAAMVVMPLTGAWCIYTMSKEARRFRIQDSAKKSKLELSARMVHVLGYLPLLALEYKWAGTYDHAHVRIACAVVTSLFLSGKYLTISPRQYYGSLARALSTRLQSAKKQLLAAEERLALK